MLVGWFRHGDNLLEEHVCDRGIDSGGCGIAVMNLFLIFAVYLKPPIIILRASLIIFTIWNGT